MPGDPMECRQHAEQCAAMARQASNPAHKETLTELAQTWLSLAIEHERGCALLDAYPADSPAGKIRTGA